MCDSFLPLSAQHHPLSLSSAPGDHFKVNCSPHHPTNYSPQTPTSPPLMSVGAQSYAANLANPHTSSSHTTSNGQPLSSPPSSTPMSTQTSQQPTVSSTNSFPTPASSVSGHHRNATPADDADSADKLWPQDSQHSNADNMDVDRSEHRRSDHDRDRLPGTTELGGLPVSTDADLMDIDSKADRSISHDPSLDALQQDIGTAFHLFKTAPTITGPDPSLDLISLYGLGPIGRSVMRVDPITGEKINRLRKSYEGKLKGLGLSGRNKAVKNEGQSGGLRHLMMWPEEEWQNQKVYGKEIRVADVDSTLHKLQTRAMKMEPGPVPNTEYWEDVLGHEKQPKNPNVDPGKRSVSTPNTMRPTVQVNGAPIPPAAEPERARPTRGKKRHYDDNSFVGYGEGFVDDEDESAFYSNSEDRSGKKKRKKEHISKMSPPMPERTGSYGVGKLDPRIRSSQESHYCSYIVFNVHFDFCIEVLDIPAFDNSDGVSRLGHVL
ncbi:Rox3 mediator complex subunit-domain-containing protein [Talaromyces proteolyticus]|uniref:Mediator of RNA polymerase II transcription subunit 19 n=1 Tax=Talaromyces proteolyticus TaxID=1131652 RepID=A0AAD4KSM5_9EURO|nr:Rox3 mediator complex subunit-domain-containing protein [Talaromyces proteolyticus]KAH8697452.1 Rox3 mediator complex subunit-domain-containing protein [Talaromyces proteolyticus]